MPRVPVSMADREKSYYKYFIRPMAAPPAERLNSITEESLDPKDALRIQDRHRLFEAGQLTGSFGWWKLEDGTAVIANQTFMPNVTGEMFDWWFAWHPIDRLRYAIWDPNDHFDVYLEDKAKALDMSKSMQERHWDSLHHIWEDIGVVMTHFLRPVDGGSELRSYFWFGWQMVDGEPVKAIPDGVEIPAMGPKSLLHHNVIEFTNLAAILPEVYAEEKDNWN